MNQFYQVRQKIFAPILFFVNVNISSTVPCLSLRMNQRCRQSINYFKLYIKVWNSGRREIVHLTRSDSFTYLNVCWGRNEPHQWIFMKVHSRCGRSFDFNSCRKWLLYTLKIKSTRHTCGLILRTKTNFPNLINEDKYDYNNFFWHALYASKSTLYVNFK